MEQLSNGHLTIKINEHGAELCSIKDSNGKEYLWQADPTYWKRHSPVLFPIVGSVWNGEFKAEGKTYKMSQHGFARDSDFELVNKNENEITYALQYNEKTLEAYPYRFRLEIGYHLQDKTIKVMWKVINLDDKNIYFQIGAHPAFYYPNYGEDGERGFFRFDIKDEMRYLKIGEKACASLQEHIEKLDNHDLKLDVHTFDIDTFIVHGSQLKKVSLLALQHRGIATDADTYAEHQAAECTIAHVAIQKTCRNHITQAYDDTQNKETYDNQTAFHALPPFPVSA